jgi:hypothetical protein
VAGARKISPNLSLAKAVRMQNGAEQAFEEILPQRTSFKDFVLDQTFRMSVASLRSRGAAGSVMQRRIRLPFVPNGRVGERRR